MVKISIKQIKDDLDIIMFDCLSHPQKAKLILEITGLLAKYIGEDYSGMTIKVDHKSRTVSAFAPNYKY